ncbi:MAG: alpha/beta hydrolase [Saprospiraceae bacterium]|nr:alpha/beta hydrolase [Saprospiraceae bacterium]
MIECCNPVGSGSPIRVNDYAFKYIEKGRGDPVVFVHGSVSDYRTWDRQVEVVSKKYRAITYSRRFHWPNREIAEGEDYSMLRHVSDLDAILSTLEQPVHLIGHSYGAFICLLLAMESPNRIRSLVLAEPPAITLFVSHSPRPLEILKLLLTRPLTAIALVKLGSKGIAPATKAIKRSQVKKAVKIFGTAVLGSETFSNLPDVRMEQVYQNVIKTEFLGSGFPPLEAKKIREINIPTLLISGEKSPDIFSLLLDRLQELLPNARKKVIQGASHLVHEDSPRKYNGCVLSFMEEQRK